MDIHWFLSQKVAEVYLMKLCIPHHLDFEEYWMQG